MTDTGHLVQILTLYYACTYSVSSIRESWKRKKTPFDKT